MNGIKSFLELHTIDQTQGIQKQLTLSQVTAQSILVSLMCGHAQINRQTHTSPRRLAIMHSMSLSRINTPYCAM